MVLELQSPGIHNAMAGQRIPHPTSTNYDDDDDDFACPAAKRLRGPDDIDSSSSRHVSPVRPVEAIDNDREIPDSDAESEVDNLPPSQTELESALPPVRTDKEAIADYEAARAADASSVQLLKGRLGERTWARGRSSIYVDAFNLALETVLEEETHLFDEPEMQLFEDWRNLSYEAQYLYVRLFLRKAAAWHRIGRLRYYDDISEPAAALKELQRNRLLPGSSAPGLINPGEDEAPEDATLQDSYSFADSSDNHDWSLEEASSLLRLDELKTIAKDVKAQGKTKKDLLQALRRTSSRQSGLGWQGLKRSDTEESMQSVDSASSEAPEHQKVNRDAHFVQKILECTGECVRLSSAPRKLFERVHLVFYRSTEWTEKSLTTIILARISRRNFPDYIVSRSTNIFPSRGILLEFEAAIRTQFRVDNLIEGGGPVIENLTMVQRIFEAVYPRWTTLVTEEQLKEEREYESGEGAYLRRFSPAWVYTRIVHKGLLPLARFKAHKREHELLVELLDQKLFHAARRGAWYQRKALLEEHYMWALSPSDGRSDDLQKRHWKKIALETCETGLQDHACHLIYHYDLQKRITKLEKSLKVAKRLQHEFGHAVLANPLQRTVEGIRIERPPSTVGGRKASDMTSRRGAKTIWIDEREGGGECSVEAMCLSWYRDQGWKGFHSEGGIIRTLFAYLFADILYTYIPNVFQTEYQTCPLDLHTDAFYPARRSEINHRCADISNGAAPRVLRDIYDREHDKETCIVGLDWTYDIADLEEIIACFHGEALAAVCKLMAQEYQQRGGGLPDLFMWHPEKREVMFAEVKSENDRLSDTQRLWIHVLLGAGIHVELCNAVAQEVRTVD